MGLLRHFASPAPGNKVFGGILTGTEIARQVDLGNIQISDFDSKHINPNSYNVRLGNTVTIYNSIKVIDMHDPSTYQGHEATYEIKSDGFVLRPGITYLIPVLEEIYTPIFEPILTGRSSIGRLGIRVHDEAGFGDIGFRGHFTLQMHVTLPTKIYAGDPMAQIYFLTPYGDTDIQYNGKYQNNGVTSSQWKGSAE